MELYKKHSILLSFSTFDSPHSIQKTMSQKIKILIDGNFQDSKATEYLPVENPATQEILAEVPLTHTEEIDEAIEAAREAFKTWKELYPFIPLLFKEPNPAPIKYVLSKMGLLDSSELRLPLTQISEGLKEKLNSIGYKYERDQNQFK